MSIKSDSRKLQRLTGRSYTRCLHRLRQCISLTERDALIELAEKRLSEVNLEDDAAVEALEKELGL